MKKFLLALVISTPVLAGEGAAPKAPTEDTGTAPQKDEATATESADGKETICKQDSRVRKVTLSKGQDGTACQVSYLKETEAPGAAKVLWSSKQQADYCQEHATAFVEKLKGMGWSCQ